MFQVALTGNVAAGKSTVAALLAERGATVIDADALTREVQAPGSPTLAAIAAAFGAGMLTPEGALDRARMRALVLADPAARRRLEAIVHPAVAAARAARLRQAEAAGARIVVSDIPLLFEALDPATFDLVLLVDAPEPVRLARLVTTRGLSEAEAGALMAAQLPAAAKRAWRGPRGERALVLENAGDRAALAREVARAWAEITARAAAG